MEATTRFDGIDDHRSGPLRRAVAALEDESAVADRLDRLEAARRESARPHPVRRPGWCGDGRRVQPACLQAAGVVSLSPCVRARAGATHRGRDGHRCRDLAAAIASALPPGGLMWTVDLRPESGEYARRLLGSLGLSVFVVTGRFDEILDQVLFEAEPLDLLFVDGHHQYQPTLDYTDQAAGYLSTRRGDLRRHRMVGRNAAGLGGDPHPGPVGLDARSRHRRSVRRPPLTGHRGHDLNSPTRPGFPRSCLPRPCLPRTCWLDHAATALSTSPMIMGGSR